MQSVTEWLTAGARVTRLRASDVLIADAAITRALGYGGAHAGAMPAHMAGAMARLREVAGKLIEPRFLWVAMPAEVTGREVLCRGPQVGRLAVGGIVASQLRKCTAVAVFVVTIGDALEGAARQMMAEGEALEGFMLDALGSVAADACAEAAVREIAREAHSFGLQATNRYSPGYCTWETSNQHSLFALLPAEPAGVRLTLSGLMQPIKSVSGVFGLGAAATYQEYPCAFCGMEDCRQRLAESTA
jgi:hypothetical protein